MTMAPGVTCPHCGATNPAGMQFCASCGKALPAAFSTGPRVVGAAEYAGTAAGQELQLDELHKQAKRASGALLALAIILTIVAGLIFFLVRKLAGGGGGGMNPRNAQVAQMLNDGTAIVLGIVAAVFWGLYFWSRVQPLPAAIAGLVIWGTVIVLNVVMFAAAASSGEEVRGSPVGCLDIVIIIVLAQAITAGAKHRKMTRELRGAA